MAGSLKLEGNHEEQAPGKVRRRETKGGWIDRYAPFEFRSWFCFCKPNLARLRSASLFTPVRTQEEVSAGVRWATIGQERADKVAGAFSFLAANFPWCVCLPSPSAGSYYS